MLLAVDVVVVRTISRVSYRVLGIKAIRFMKLFQQWDEAIHVGTVLTDVSHSNVFICNTKLDIICRKKLVIAHIVFLDTHEGCRRVCLGITVVVGATNCDLFDIVFELCRIFLQTLIVPLLGRFAMSDSMDKLGFVDFTNGSVASDYLF